MYCNLFWQLSHCMSPIISVSESEPAPVAWQCSETKYKKCYILFRRWTNGFRTLHTAWKNNQFKTVQNLYFEFKAEKSRYFCHNWLIKYEQISNEWMCLIFKSCLNKYCYDEIFCVLESTFFKLFKKNALWNFIMNTLWHRKEYLF